MTDNTRATLDRLMDEVPISPAPIGTMLSAGRSAKRRKHRAVITGAALATVVILGGGAMATQAFEPDEPTDTNVANSAPPTPPAELDLTVRTEIDNTPETHRLLAPVDATDGPVWDPDEGVLYYATGYTYSTGCPPTGTATGTGTGDITLTLQHPTGACRADVRRALVVIGELQGAPTSLTVVEAGTTHTDHIKLVNAETGLVDTASTSCAELLQPPPPVPATPVRPIPDKEAQHITINQSGTVAAWFAQSRQLPELIVFDLAGNQELAREDLGVGDVAEEPSLRILGDALYYRTAADSHVWMRYAWDHDAYPIVYMTCR